MTLSPTFSDPTAPKVHCTMTEHDMMIAGEMYRAADPQLVEMRLRARRLCREFNTSTEAESDRRRSILRRLLGELGTNPEVEPDFRCDYGHNISAGDNLFINFGCVILDCARVRLGSRVFFGPGVHLYTATHPIDPVERASGREYAKPITIGNDVWLGGHATICPGVTIGDAAVIGAGSVVTRDVPSRVVVAGNPAKVMRNVDGAV